MIVMFRFATPHQFLSKIEHKSVRLTLTFRQVSKLHTPLITKKYIFSIDRENKARSVHENDQHVQGWDPTKLNTMVYDRLAT